MKNNLLLTGAVLLGFWGGFLTTTLAFRMIFSAS